MKTEEEQKNSEFCASKMQSGKNYVVAHGSNDGEFCPGDRVILLPTGDILLPSFGLMHAADVPEATRGMRVCRLTQEGEE